MPGLPLMLCEREEIERALLENREMSWAEIARRTGRHPTTIMRDVTENHGRGRYRAGAAQRAAERALRRPRERRLAVPGELRDRVTRELRQGRSPYAICADLHAEAVLGAPCVETLYTAIYTRTLNVKATECLRSRRPRRRCRQERHPSKRAGLPNIGDRPEGVNCRGEIGHWEADQIIGKGNGSSMLWLTERVTRYCIGITMPLGYTADAVLAGLVEALERIPAHLRRSLTFDQGCEWAEWATLTATYKLACWFCDPHSPWQRGQIENLNRQIRWWFPRGTRLDNITQATADHTANILNNQRRRSLNHHSPAMLYAAASTVH